MIYTQNPHCGSVVVDLIYDPVRSSPSCPEPGELSLKRMSYPSGSLDEIAGHKFDDRGRRGRGQAGESPLGPGSHG